MKRLFPIWHFKVRYHRMFRAAHLESQAAQIEFHLNHLEEYLERYSGIIHQKNVPPIQFKNDLLFCVLGAAEAIDMYFRRLFTPGNSSKWREFYDILKQIPNSHTFQILDSATMLFKKLSSDLLPQNTAQQDAAANP